MTEERKLNFVQDAVPFMETQCAIPSLSSPSEAALVSIAISMKRIADAVTVNTDETVCIAQNVDAIAKVIWGGYRS